MVSVFRQSIRTFIDAKLGPAARAKHMADFARGHTAEMIRTGRASPKYTVFVDGAEGAAEETVRPGGLIVHEFHYLGEAVTYALGFLRGRSPTGPGKPKDKRYPRPYRDCFVVAVDGRPIPAAAFNPDKVPAGAEVYVYNTQPYSRKIDTQLVGKTRLRFSVPPGLFTDAARAVRRRYGNSVSVSRVYSVSFPGQYVRVNGVTTQSPALHFKPL